MQKGLCQRRGECVWVDVVLALEPKLRIDLQPIGVKCDDSLCRALRICITQCTISRRSAPALQATRMAPKTGVRTRMPYNVQPLISLRLPQTMSRLHG